MHNNENSHLAEALQASVDFMLHSRNHLFMYDKDMQNDFMGCGFIFVQDEKDEAKLAKNCEETSIFVADWADSNRKGNQVIRYSYSIVQDDEDEDDGEVRVHVFARIVNQ